MSASVSKGSSSDAVNKLLRGTAHDAHRDLSSSSSASTSAQQQQHGPGAASFRTTNSTPWNSGTDDDFGRFAASTAAQQRVADSFQTANPANSTASHPQSALDSLLNSTAMTDEVYGDWESELLAKQAGERAELPRDPLATLPRHDKGKQRAAGDASPTTRDMISDLDSLDLASKEYLRSLLSLPEDVSIIDYIDQNRYTEDVYGLPDGVRRIVDKAKQDEEQVGREKAIRRLRMVLSQMAFDNA